MPLPSKPPIQLLIADDHEMLREGFHTMLSKHPEIKLVGEASNGLELLELAASLQPDIIIADIKMPKMDGIEATRILTVKYPHIGIIAFTMFDEESLIVEMLEAGAQGYLLKSSGKEEILEAIQAVIDGNTYYCKQTTAKLANLIARSNFRQKKFPQPIFTEKELVIIREICEQYSNKEIASRLRLSIRTVEGHRERIQDKMKIRNTAGIVVFAIRTGIYKL